FYVLGTLPWFVEYEGDCPDRLGVLVKMPVLFQQLLGGLVVGWDSYPGVMMFHNNYIIVSQCIFHKIYLQRDYDIHSRIHSCGDCSIMLRVATARSVFI